MEIPELSKLKLEFNNEVIKTKKFILQAKTQTIHKLSKKSKQLKGRKGTDEEKAKFNAKAEAIVKEIYTIKKIAHDELGRFAMENFGKLEKLMDTPVVTKEKAMAKILSHKCLKPKFQKIIDRFSVVPTCRLLEVDPRKMRRKKRKEKLKLLEKKAKEESAKNPISDNEDKDSDNNKSKKSKKDNEIKLKKNLKTIKKSKTKVEKDGEEELISEDENANLSGEDKFEGMDSSVENAASGNESSIERDSGDDEDDEITFYPPKIDTKSEPNDTFKSEYSEDDENSDNNESEDGISDKSDSEDNDLDVYNSEDINSDIKTAKKSPKTLPDKIPAGQSATDGVAVKPKRKGKIMMVDLDDDEAELVNTEKTVDSFFMTDTGDNYMTVALPRPPDIQPGTVVDENASNRRSRRAIMFGNDAPRPRKSFQKQNQFSFSKPDQKYEKKIQGNSKTQNSFEGSSFGKRDSSKNFNSSQKFNKTDSSFGPPPKVEEKLHPSWEAKKKKTTIVAFTGTKVTFD